MNRYQLTNGILVPNADGHWVTFNAAKDEIEKARREEREKFPQTLADIKDRQWRAGYEKAVDEDRQRIGALAKKWYDEWMAIVVEGKLPEPKPLEKINVGVRGAEISSLILADAINSLVDAVKGLQAWVRNHDT